MKFKNVIYDFCIFFVLIALLVSLNRVFLLKDENFYNYQNFIRQPKDSVDILVLGSSHSMNGIDAQDLDSYLNDRQISVKTFNMSVTGMRLEVMNYRLKEALKTQSPQLLIVETFSLVPLSYSNEDITRRYSIDYMPLNKNKISYVDQYISSDRLSYLFPFIKYHSRWDELCLDDFKSLHPGWVGHVSKDNGLITDAEDVVCSAADDFFASDFSDLNDTEELEPDVEAALQDLLATAASHNMDVLFLSLPYKIQMDYPCEKLIRNNNYVAENYCKSDSVHMLDLNKCFPALSWRYDYMQDEGHMNDAGCEAVLPTIGNFINEHYQFD